MSNTETQSGAAGQIPLSHTQNFLRFFDQGDDAGPFGPRYNIVVGWRITGKIDVDTLQQALTDVVARHDSLRATISRGEGIGYQEINEPRTPQLIVRDVPATEPGERNLVTEQLLSELEAGSYDSKEIPHLRAVLDRFDDTDSLLTLIAHHTASDGWSMQLLMRDTAHAYAVRRGFADQALAPARQYEEYARWQHDTADDEAVDFAREYWREKLDGAQILAITTDEGRSAGLPKTSPVYRFSISPELTTSVLDFSRAMRCSPFMVLLAAYNVVLHKMTGATDLVVPTLASGRNQPEYQETVGPFFNFVPLRTSIVDAKNFRNVVEQTRSTCIEAMSYDIPFAQILGEAPALMAPLVEENLAACAFQVWQFSTVMSNDLIGDLEISEVRSRVLSQEDGTDIPDGALLTLDIDPSGEIFGNLAYNSNLFHESSMIELVDQFRQVLQNALAAPGAPLSSI